MRPFWYFNVSVWSDDKSFAFQDCAWIVFLLHTVRTARHTQTAPVSVLGCLAVSFGVCWHVMFPGDVWGMSGECLGPRLWGDIWVVFVEIGGARMWWIWNNSESGLYWFVWLPGSKMWQIFVELRSTFLSFSQKAIQWRYFKNIAVSTLGGKKISHGDLVRLTFLVVHHPPCFQSKLELAFPPQMKLSSSTKIKKKNTITWNWTWSWIEIILRKTKLKFVDLLRLSCSCSC